MKARFFIVATWVLHTLATPVDVSAQEALTRSIEAERANLKRAEVWVYDETITYTNVFNSGKRKKTGSAEFEVMALEGRPYYRLVRRNGKKLKSKEQAAEDARMERVSHERQQGYSLSERPRLAIPFSQLADDHIAGWQGDRLVTTPRIPGLRRMTDLITTEQLLDSVTMLRRKVTVHFLESSGINPENTEITVEYVTMPDGTSLTQRILYRRPYRQGWHETEQVYENFHKFEAESVVKPVAQVEN